jgi:Big-like domain-containing protein
MKAFVFRSVLALLVGTLLIVSLSCARDQQLVSIQVQPAVENFSAADPALNVQLRALGSYIHPPVTKDITDQVTWASNTPNMVTVNSTGLIAPAGFACGNTLISATVTTNHSAGNRSSSGAIITGYMTANVACVSATGPILTVNFAGLGTGNVVSSPAGLSCASSAVTCSAGFVSGTPVSLTASATGTSTFGGWVGCDSVSGVGQTVCNINSLTANRAVTVTFN